MATFLEKQTIELKIKREVERGRNKFILYPFGDLGNYAKKILNNNYNIQESLLIDNNANMEEGVYPLEYLKSYPMQDEYILIVSSNLQFYSEIRDELKKYVSDNKIIDLFEKRSFVCQIAQEYDEYLAGVSGFDFINNIYALKKYDIKFYLPFWKTDLIQRQILFNDQYYENNLLYFVTKNFNGGIKLENGVVLDIGANIGNHSIYFLKECGAKKVIAFEPVKETFNILKRNIEINDLEDKVVLYNCGVGELRSKAAFEEYDLHNIGGTTLYDKEDGDIEIFSIDSLNLDDDVTFMKVDVEGFEEKVIRGALETIKKYRPVIMLEAWDRSNTIENIIMLLSDLGYDFSFIEAENYIFYRK